MKNKDVRYGFDNERRYYIEYIGGEDLHWRLYKTFINQNDMLREIELLKKKNNTIRKVY